MQIAPPPAEWVKPTLALDVECYRNLFLVKLYDIATKRFHDFELCAGKPFNWAALRLMLTTSLIVTFNGNKYDMIMVSAAAAGFSNDQLKQLSDAIINGYTRPNGYPVPKGETRPWEVVEDFRIPMLELDHIDLFEVAPGTASLKTYGGRLHCDKMQDLPIDVAKWLTPDEMQIINKYCGNDLITTAQLYIALKEEIQTRIDLTAQYGVDMRSKSDAQIAEAALKKLLGYIKKPQYNPGHTFRYNVPAFLRFQTPIMQQTLQMIAGINWGLSAKGIATDPPELRGRQIGKNEYEGYIVELGGARYKMGIGGLHSQEKTVAHVAGPDCYLVDFDVGSYYPKIISILKLYPEQIGPIFLEIYNGWITIRLEYKHKGEKKKAATFKIKLNGTFGKTNEKHSIMFSPEMFIHIVITGQLSLLMLIERFVLAGIEVVQGNTDGIVTKCRADQRAIRDAIVKQWERDTGFEMEDTHYKALYSKDVNNYLAFKVDYTDKKTGKLVTDDVKTKGEYADPGLAKNPTNKICVEAVIAYLLTGTPLETTIRRCTDIRKFVTIRNVKGGGEWVAGATPDAKALQREKRARALAAGWHEAGKDMWFRTDRGTMMGEYPMYTLDQAYRSTFKEANRHYLGKVVRWYYGVGQGGYIAGIGTGAKVGKSDGCKPCMDLPPVLPPDVNYPVYVEEAKSMLSDIGALK